LKPALPKDESVILELGFTGNISEDKKFITDGHSLILAERVTKGWEIERPKDGWKPVKVDSIQKLWDGTVSREGKAAEFIGCGKISEVLEDGPTFVAVLRKEDGATVCVNPWILQFAVLMVSAESLSVDPGPTWFQKPILLHRGVDVVAMIMPMRFTGHDLADYNLTGPAVPLGDGIHAVS
jgi:hypothetical protein